MTPAAVIEQLALLFLPSVRLVLLPRDADRSRDDVVVVEALPPGESEPASLRDGDTAVLVVPDRATIPANLPSPATVLVAVERHDGQMARRLIELLNPAGTNLELLHVAWLPGIVPSPTAGAGLDNPQPTDLMAYDGAKEALLDCAAQLRAGGFNVATHLRENRATLEALTVATQRYTPALVVLGRGRHGVGLGRSLLREQQLPVLYVAARGR
jgi:hypothetical protein